MKKIEEKMIQAINNKQNFKNTNTEVKIIKNCVFVFLYSTIIFASVQGRQYFSDGGYKTITTGSRLRALGTGYSINNKKNLCKLTPQNKIYKMYLNTLFS